MPGVSRAPVAVEPHADVRGDVPAGRPSSVSVRSTSRCSRTTTRTSGFVSPRRSRIVEIAEPLAVFHDTAGSYSKRWDGARSEADYYRVIERALERCPERYGPFREVITADAHLHWGILYLVRGDRARARGFLRRSIRTVPTATALALMAAAWLPHEAFRAGARVMKRALARTGRGARAGGEAA